MTGQHVGEQDPTWRRFTSVTAVAVGAAVVIGLALSYASLYRVAFNAGYADPWLTWGWSVRPAHLFPLTLDLPILVGYAGRIALAGRRSAVWATGVLVACSVGTVAAQVVDGANWVAEHEGVQAVIHGWPPLSVFLTLHLLVMILQALGYLVPPQESARPSWPARVWAWARRLRADIETAPAAATPGAWVDMDVDIRGGHDRDIDRDIRPPATGTSMRTSTGTLGAGMSTSDRDIDRDMDRDIHADIGADIRGADVPVGGADTDRDNPQVNGRMSRSADRDIGRDAGGVVTPLRGRRKLTREDAVAAVAAKELSKAEAARRAGVTAKTVTRWVKESSAPDAEASW